MNNLRERSIYVLDRGSRNVKIKKEYWWLVGGILIGWFFNKTLTEFAHDVHAPRPIHGGLGDEG